MFRSHSPFQKPAMLLWSIFCGFLVFATEIPRNPQTQKKQLDPQVWIDKVTKEKMAQHDPGRPIIFEIFSEEKSHVGSSWWSVAGEARYALLPAWDGQAMGTSEGLYGFRGGPLGLKPGEFLQFYVKEFESKGSAAIGNDKYAWSETIKDGLEQVNECGGNSTHQEKYADLSDAVLKRTQDGATLTFTWELNTRCDFGAGANILGFSDQEAKQILTFQLTEEDLRNWDRVRATSQGTIRGEGKDPSYPVSLSARLVVVDSAPGEVTVEIPEYESWVPKGNLDDPSAAGASLDVKVKAHKTGRPEEPLDKKVTFTFKLEDVSSEPGICMNFPRGDSADNKDLKFLEKTGKNQNIEILSEVSARTKDPAAEATFTVSSLDFGGWGRLAIEAETTDHRKLPVRFQGKRDESIPIPRDLETDHVADSWEEQHGVGKGATEDNDAQPAGQACNGDGMSTYEEYRGFVVSGSGGGRVHQRMNPGTKELFIIDEASIFDTAAWKKASEITAVRLAPDMVKGGEGDSGRIVNFRNGFAHTGNKYCLKIDLVPPGGAPRDTIGPPTWTLGRSYPRIIPSPKFAQKIEVYPGNIRDWFDFISRRLANAVANPNSQDGESFKALGLPQWMWKNALEKLGEDTKEKLVGQLVRQTAIHEVGHACGLPGHRGSYDDEETDQGNPQCFMKYLDKLTRRELLVLQVLFKSDAALPLQYSIFCKDPDFDCWKHLNVKDE